MKYIYNVVLKVKINDYTNNSYRVIDSNYGFFTSKKKADNFVYNNTELYKKIHGNCYNGMFIVKHILH